MDPKSAFAKQGEAHIIDVREQSEWNAGHIEGALHIPMGEIPERLDDIPDGRALVAVCRSGGRSEQVARFLSDKGFEIENLDGGMEAWAKAGLPIVGPDGGPGRVV
ncbi:MAG: rhodanese-like domain-containing protein [Actinomycetota bacterium]